MNAKVERTSGMGAADYAQLALALLLVVGGIVAYYYFSSWSPLMRGSMMTAVVVVALIVFAFTAPGRSTREFLVESQFELRKVVWPSRETTLRTTGVVIVVVIILSLLLGLIDVILKWAVLDHLLKLGQ
ncbi:MAG: preprotein translocase subunit SecE [Dokdonella sp.]